MIRRIRPSGFRSTAALLSINTGAKTRPAVQQLGNGEAYDFEFIPTEPGQLRFLVTSGVGVPLVSMAVLVKQ